MDDRLKAIKLRDHLRKHPPLREQDPRPEYRIDQVKVWDRTRTLRPCLDSGPSNGAWRRKFRRK